MGIEEFNDRLIYCNPYINPLGWTSHFEGDYTTNSYDSTFVKFYENNKKRNADNDDLKKFFPMLDLTTKIEKKVVENPENVIKAATNPILYHAGEEVAKEPSKLLRGVLGPVGSVLDTGSDTKKVTASEKIPSNLKTEERQDYIREHGGGLRCPEKSDNSAAIVAGGCAILAGLTVAADCVFAKGKHVKQITKAFKKTPKVKTAKTAKPVKKPPKAPVQIRGRQFSSIQEAEAHFRNMGIDVDLSKCTDLRQLSQIDAELAKIKAMGIDSQVKSITVTPFDRQSMLNATRARGIELTENVHSGIYGYSDKGHIFLNSNGNGFRRMANGSDVIKHEIGHYHRNVLRDNVYGAAEGNNEVFLAAVKNIAQKTNMTTEQVIEKLTSRLHSEVKAYSPMADESFADMFSLMIDGKQYSKGAMLFYDMAGGGRIPNKVINGVKYDDYICSLYEDAENILMNYIR